MWWLKMYFVTMRSFIFALLFFNAALVLWNGLFAEKGAVRWRDPARAENTALDAGLCIGPFGNKAAADEARKVMKTLLPEGELSEKERIMAGGWALMSEETEDGDAAGEIARRAVAAGMRGAKVVPGTKTSRWTVEFTRAWSSERAGEKAREIEQKGFKVMTRELPPVRSIWLEAHPWPKKWVESRAAVADWMASHGGGANECGVKED